MTISEKFLEYFGLNEGENEEGDKAYLEPTIVELTEMEIEEVVNELAIKHADTEDYRQTVGNLKTLAEAYEKMTKAEVELEKAKLDLTQSKAKKRVDWTVFGPKAIGILVYGLVTVSFIAIEREHPPAMRLVQAAGKLIDPKI